MYSRKCVEEAEKANSNACLKDELFNDNNNPNIQLMSCETCTEDGCNRIIKNYFVSEMESSDSNFGVSNVLIDSTTVALHLLTIIICSLFT